MFLSESIRAELDYVFAMILYGSFVSFCYHIVIFVRTLFYHAREVVDAQDILFLSGAGFFFFFVVYKKNDGILRWYAFASFLLGIYFYVSSFAKILEFVRKRLLQKHRKTVKIKAKFFSKGQVPVDEGTTPQHGKKEKKKKRS